MSLIIEIRSSVNPELTSLEAGQQCTFDKKGELITHGEGAGTPDAYSPSEYTNVLDHYKTDVFTAKNLSIKDYHEQWTPNNDNNCAENWGDRVTKPELQELPKLESSTEKPTSDKEPNSESDRANKSEINQQPSLDSNPESDRFNRFGNYGRN